jgi:hypothetical protein
MSNTFGVPNGASLLIYDNYKKFQPLTTSCGKNPEYASYCFHPGINVDGDYVSAVIHGYNIKNVNDVSFKYKIK